MTTQADIGAWHRTKFDPCPLDWLGLKLAEETGEVADAAIVLYALELAKRAGKVNRVLLGMAGEPVREGRVHAQLPAEAADVLIVLYALADRAGFDLDQALAERFGVVSQREFTTLRGQAATG